jgi:cytochrome c-type biogenesis protein CcmH/NrfG
MKTNFRDNHLSNPVINGLMLLIFIFQITDGLGQETLNQGIRMFEAKNYYGAERYFQNVLNNNRENDQALFYLGRIALEKGDLDGAVDLFEKAIDLQPSKADYYAWKGITYIQQLSKVDFMKQAIYAPKAQNSLEKAVELDPGHIEARIWLAGYYANAPSFAGGSRQKARDQFEKIFTIDPDNKEALLNQGIILTSFEEYDDALASFEKILDLQEDYYPACFHIGRLSKESGRFHDQGELSLIKFIDHAEGEFQDSKDEAWWLLGEIYLQQHKTREARQAFENALSLEPENEEYQKSLKNIL